MTPNRGLVSNCFSDKKNPWMENVRIRFFQTLYLYTMCVHEIVVGLLWSKHTIFREIQILNPRTFEYLKRLRGLV